MVSETPLTAEIAALIGDPQDEATRVTAETIVEHVAERLTGAGAVTVAHMAYWDLAPGDAQYRDLINGGIRARRAVEAALAYVNGEVDE